MGKKIDLTELVFGRLTVIKEHEFKTPENKYKYECICSCGNPDIVVKSAQLLRNGQTKSCGCLQRENMLRQCAANTGAIRSHGMTNTVTHICWKNMKSRCDDINQPAFVNYGGRGISYPEKWDKFEGFFEDMGEAPEGLSLNRIDANLNYSKENCEWADRDKQSRDRRKPKSGVTSDYKGVSFNKDAGKYKASLAYKGVVYHLGYSDDPLLLALRYDAKVVELTGEDCGTNKQLGLLE